MNKPLRCPNCKKNLELKQINTKYKKQTYDKWTCKECTHIIVLDYRG